MDSCLRHGQDRKIRGVWRWWVWRWLRSCLLAMFAVSSVNAFEELRYLELMGLYFGLNVKFCWIYTIYTLWFGVSCHCQDVENVPFHLRKAVPLHLVEAGPGRTWQDLAGPGRTNGFESCAMGCYRRVFPCLLKYNEIRGIGMDCHGFIMLYWLRWEQSEEHFESFRYISTRQHSTSNQVIVVRCCKSQGSDFEEVREGPAVIANSGHRYEVMDRSETVKVKGIRPCCKSFTVGMLSVRWQVCLKCKSFVVGCSQHITRRSKGEHERATWNDLKWLEWNVEICFSVSCLSMAVWTWKTEK